MLLSRPSRGTQETTQEIKNKKTDGEFVKGWGGIWSWGSVKHVKAQVLSFHNDQGTLHLTVLFVNLSVVYFDGCTLYF